MSLPVHSGHILLALARYFDWFRNTIGVTQKTAWFILGRLREACGGTTDPEKLKGVVEIDECFVGGLEGNKHKGKKLNMGC